MMPPIMAGVVSIYGLVVSVLIVGGITDPLPLFSAFTQLGSGLAVGLCGLAAGYVYQNSFIFFFFMSMGYYVEVKEFVGYDTNKRTKTAFR